MYCELHVGDPCKYKHFLIRVSPCEVEIYKSSSYSTADDFYLLFLQIILIVCNTDVL